MSDKVNRFRKVLHKIISEQIDKDRDIVKNLDAFDKCIKKLNKDYRALINNSFSRIVFDDGNGGTLFEIELYPLDMQPKKEDNRYDLRAILFNTDRIYRKGLSVDEVCAFIQDELKPKLDGDSDDESDYNKIRSKERRALPDQESINEAKKKKENPKVKDSESDEMEEVGKIDKQIDKKPVELTDVDVEELFPGMSLETLVDKVEAAVWGSIKREVAEKKKQKLKAKHEVSNLNTKKDTSTVSKSKFNSKKTDKLKAQSKK
jgi:hypothetical protein